VPEWLKGADCKSVTFRYVGSNPTRPIKYYLKANKVFNFRKKAKKIEFQTNSKIKSFLGFYELLNFTKQPCFLE
jgi:hypothetical protein